MELAELVIAVAVLAGGTGLIVGLVAWLREGKPRVGAFWAMLANILMGALAELFDSFRLIIGSWSPIIVLLVMMLGVCSLGAGLSTARHR